MDFLEFHFQDDVDIAAVHTGTKLIIKVPLKSVSMFVSNFIYETFDEKKDKTSKNIKINPYLI